MDSINTYEKNPDPQHSKKKQNKILSIIQLVLIALIMFSLVFCASSSSQIIKASAYNPVMVKSKKLPGRLSNYPEYTYNWISKAMSVTSRIRGLDFTQYLKFFTTTVEELPGLVRTDNPQENEILEDFFHQIGFLSENETFYDSNTNEEQDYSSVAGFYGIGTNTFVIVTDASLGSNPYSPVRFSDVVLVHELTHALQDMNFNLSKTIKKIDSYKKHTDSLMAFKSLMEGDATLTQYLFLMRESPNFWHLKGEQKNNFIRRISDRFSSSGYGGMIETDIPDYWVRNTVFTYLQGAGFVSQLYLAGNGYNLINKAISEKIPVSTEQIMHPVKYINNDIPSEIEIPILHGAFKSEGGGAWNRKYEDTLGEFNIYVLMDKYLTKKGMNANKIAEGWDGDRVEYFTDYSTNDDAMVWISVWDTKKDAQEFFEAYISLMAEKHKNKNIHMKLYKNGKIMWEDSNKNLSYATISGSDGKLVYILEDIPKSSFDSVKKELFTSKITINQ